MNIGGGFGVLFSVFIPFVFSSMGSGNTLNQLLSLMFSVGSVFLLVFLFLVTFTFCQLFLLLALSSSLVDDLLW
jgi:hypothetical protein